MIKRFFKDVIYAIKDPKRDFQERVFILFTIISDIAVIIALIGDLIMGEDFKEIIVLVATIIGVPIITFTCMYKKRMKFAMRFIVITLVVVILPTLYFFGGGLRGGGFLWIIFAFMYVGLVMTGAWRAVLLAVLFALSLTCYLISYYHPELLTVHSEEKLFVDTFISLILVGVVCYVMTWFQNQLFKDENARAKKETERAEELTRSQNRFFSSMSHEIRTPINSILGLNELILRDQTASDEVVKDATGIQGAGKLLLALINDILDFSKMEAGSMDIVPVDYHVGDMLSEIVNMIWLKAHDKGLLFNVTVDPKVPNTLYGDEVRIKQIIINLLNNAVKYTQEGSVDLHIESEEAGEDKVLLRISISDTGMGIKKEALPNLFDAFKRVDEEKNRYIEGTGLGLSIVKQLVELMDGTVTVNSVYGEGSTFTVVVKQGISDHAQIGELNIHNQSAIKREAYEASFKAAEARILIVDDNEMNLEVEKKLLAGTDMAIDTSISGRDALEMTLKNTYDVILMDHLMPGMDGIECLKNIRNQTGGLNRTVPIIVLTANAGSDNRDLYNRAGFDGYLVKPVSGDALESILIKHIRRDKLVLSERAMNMREDINISAGYAKKEAVVITATSMCDLPDAIIKKFHIPILPFYIQTEEGVFRDVIQMDANELIKYINRGKNAVSVPPDVKDYTEFFANALKRAHSVIHIALTTSMSPDYERATEAAKAFENVTVINSGVLSSSTGILVLMAYKLAQQNYPVAEIVSELENVKQRLRCSFVIDKTEFMAKKGLVRNNVNRISKALNMHPCIRFRDDRYGIGGIWMGSTKFAYKRYIHKAFPVDIIPDSDVVFITYADVPIETLQWIKEEISKFAYFEKVVFKQASAAISSNCGPGTVGILYFVKSNKSYNIGSFIDDVSEDEADEEAVPEIIYTNMARRDENEEVEVETEAAPADDSEDLKEPAWYREIECIDGDIAIKNSGSEDAFKTVLKIFYDSIPAKSEEIESYYSAQDWENYTIKIHALKSSAKLVGAMELSEKAQDLETAGKESDIDYIKNNHDSFMKDYLRFNELLKGVFEHEESKAADESKPMADEYLLQSAYEGLKEAAENMDCDTIEDILKELSDYALPESDGKKIKEISEKAGNFDYDGILSAIDN